MADGMSKFLDSPIKSIKDWDRYCYYAAGVVGIGLSKMWVVSGLETKQFLSSDLKNKSKEMGLFLQKTNIIRDCREDMLENRAFLPQVIWGKYVWNYSELFNIEYKKPAILPLNEHVTDALRHLPNCLDYMKAVTSPAIFRFCAIPQVMAIATLALCYNNYDVYLKSVKISRYDTIRIMRAASNYPNTAQVILLYTKQIHDKIAEDDPNQSLQPVAFLKL